MYWGDEVGAVLADVGRRTARLGYAGEDVPRRVTPVAALLGRAVPAEGATDRASVEALWARALRDLNASASDRPVLAVVDAFADAAERATLAEVLLEGLSAPACYAARSPALSAFASGRATALVVDVGHGSATVAPVFDGYTLLEPCRRSADASGAALSARVASRLAKKLGGYASDAGVVADVKHTACRAWRIPPFDSRLAEELDPVEFALPDGTAVRLGPERFEVCEPHVAELRSAVRAALEAADADVRRPLTQEVIVVGGGSLLDGLGERLGKDLAESLPSAFRPRVMTPGTKDERLHSAFVGGSVLASLGTFQQLWLSRKEWDEAGPARAVQERFVM